MKANLQFGAYLVVYDDEWFVLENMGDLCGGGLGTSLLLCYVNILSTLLTLGG